MARRLRKSGFETRTARLKLAVRKKPYHVLTLLPGVSLLYRRNKKAGRWIVKVLAGNGRNYWINGFADADDHTDANGKTILTFFQAQDPAKELARGSNTEAAPADAPITVDKALTDYVADLRARGANIYNALHPRKHLPAAMLAKPVMLLTSYELEHWRNNLAKLKPGSINSGNLKPESINRMCNGLCAAFMLAADHDARIVNQAAWKKGLHALPITQTARNVILPDAKVLAFVSAAQALDPALGLFVAVVAETGTRPSQASRLRVEDLVDHPNTPTLMMPRSGKGGGRNRSEKKAMRYTVPITPALAKKLRAAAQGREPEAPLLLQSNGLPWGNDASQAYRCPIRAVVTDIGENPDRVTLYALRHSNITRMLLKGIPIGLVAGLHDTSVRLIEKHYSRHITEHAAEYARPALLGERADSPPAGKVVPIGA